MATARKDGGRTIVLFLPFKHEGKTIEAIGLSPVTWNHTLKWQSGEYNKAMDLLFELAEQPEAVIRAIRYPDVDRVMTQFFEMLPPEIRESIASGMIPKKVTVPQEMPDNPEELIESDVAPVEEEPQKAPYTPYRMPTKEEIANDMKAHPPPEDPFAHLKPDETGLGFEVNDA